MQDARYSHISLVCGGGMRAYLASPLVMPNGHIVGSVCFLDTSKREFGAGDCFLMNNIAQLIAHELEVGWHEGPATTYDYVG